MNKNTFVKFSLTVLASAVLAACSGGGNKAAPAPAKPAPVENPVVDAAATETAKEEAKDADKAAQEAKVFEKIPSVGHKFVKKSASDLEVGFKREDVDSSASKSVTALTVALEPSLDTIVVAQTIDANGNLIPGAPHAYLEDFDFRGNVDNTTGSHVLKHIYLSKEGETNKVSDSDAVTVRGETLTKTKNAGADEGVAFVYEKGRRNYTPYAGVSKVLDDENNIVRRTEAFLTDNDNVAEVYGNRTFTEGNSLTDEEYKYGGKNEVDGVKTANALLDNTPFGFKDANNNYSDARLTHVQYGRVTSKLHGVSSEQLVEHKKGIRIGQLDTRLARYGVYGDKNTENHYFYRGVNDTKADEVAKLADVYGSNAVDGNLTYQGHAVTYNLDHTLRSTDALPNAVGYTEKLLSGTHVKAKVNLATKAVDGSLYDVWSYGNRRSADGFKAHYENQLATFTGSVDANGTISGTSQRLGNVNTKDGIVGQEGVFNASLFGGHAQELGGELSSVNAEAGKASWGAVFGAHVQEVPFVAPLEPTRPVPVKRGRLGDAGDQNNVGSPLQP